jgi:hypothetical protein
MRAIHARSTAFVICTILFGVLQCVALDSEKFKEEQYSAVAIVTSGPASGKSLGLNIYIHDITSDEEVHQLADVLKTKGPDGLEDALNKIKEKGRIAPNGGTGNDVSVVRVLQTKNGKRIRMVTNRNIGFLELRESPRIRDYKFSVLELRLDASGKGEGTLLYATKLKFNKKGELELENYGERPIRLANVRQEK